MDHAELALDDVLAVLDDLAEDADVLNARIQALLASSKARQRQDWRVQRQCRTLLGWSVSSAPVSRDSHDLP